MNSSSTDLHTVVLSPHLDDGVLSCGGLINQLRRQGESCSVVTFFTADVPAHPPTAFTETVFHYMDLSPTNGMHRRREEDVRACSTLDAQWQHLDFSEAICRTVPGEQDENAHPYDSVRTLFAEPNSKDRETVLPKLLVAMGRLPPAHRWLVPLGIGGHVDHRLLREAAEAAASANDDKHIELFYYEDFPYTLKLKNRLRVLGTDAIDFARWLGSRSPGRLRPESSALTQEDLDQKIEAIACYESQVAPLFGNASRLGRAVRSYALKVGGERLWRT